jgi:uncharacterized protein (DUF1778 family)
MVPKTRTELFNLRMTTDEVSMLKAIAEMEGLSASDIIRQCIRREHRARFEAKVPKKKKK